MTTADETPAQPETEVCCVCGSTDVGYHNYRDQPFCWPCADGKGPNDDQPDVAPAPAGNAGGADVYREAAKAMFELADGDNDDLFEWQNCPACPNGVRCACSGIPYPSAPVRAAIDTGRAPLLAEVERLTAETERFMARADSADYQRDVARRDLAEAIRERDKTRTDLADLIELAGSGPTRAELEAANDQQARELEAALIEVAELKAKTDGGGEWQWGVRFVHESRTEAPEWVEWLDGTRAYAEDYRRRWLPEATGHLIRRLVTLGPIEPVTDDGGEDVAIAEQMLPAGVEVLPPWDGRAG